MGRVGGWVGGWCTWRRAGREDCRECTSEQPEGAGEISASGRHSSVELLGSAGWPKVAQFLRPARPPDGQLLHHRHVVSPPGEGQGGPLLRRRCAHCRCRMSRRVTLLEKCRLPHCAAPSGTSSRPTKRRLAPPHPTSIYRTPPRCLPPRRAHLLRRAGCAWPVSSPAHLRRVPPRSAAP